MRRQLRPVQRNTLDLADRVQVRTVTRKLRLSERELTALVERIGHSISAISKEVNMRRAAENVTPAVVPVPPAAVIDAVKAQELAISAEAQASAGLA